MHVAMCMYIYVHAYACMYASLNACACTDVMHVAMYVCVRIY